MRWLLNRLAPVTVDAHVRPVRFGFRVEWNDGYGTASAIIRPDRSDNTPKELAGREESTKFNIYIDPWFDIPFGTTARTTEPLDHEQFYLLFRPSHAELNDRGSTPGTSALIVANCIAYIASVFPHWADLFEPSPAEIIRAGALLGAVTEPWRLFTNGFLHANWLHLLFNMIGLLYVGKLCERIIGTRKFLLVYLVGGLGGALTSVLMYPKISVGASGAIMGLCGFLCAYRWLHRAEFKSPMASGILSTFCLLVLFAVAVGLPIPFIDNAAHIGGVLIGALMACALIGRRDRNAALPLSAGVLTVSLCVAMWLGACYRYSKLGWDHEAAAIRYGANENWQPAIDELTKAIAQNPSSVEAYSLRSYAADKVENFELSIADLKFMISKDSSSLALYNNLAWEQIAAGLYKEAIQNVNHYLSAKIDASALDTRAVAYIGLGNYDSAETDLNTAIKLKQRTGAAHFHRGQLFLLRGNKEQSSREFSISEQLGYKPDKWETRFGKPNW